ncbi:uncharacterized [Tachysurus ichikawai]
MRHCVKRETTPGGTLLQCGTLLRLEISSDARWESTPDATLHQMRGYPSCDTASDGSLLLMRHCFRSEATSGKTLLQAEDQNLLV